ncbi:hypothetical protein [Reinekea sp.]|jgi:hypothetical protein|uniref:hypothetical protein n=1 Tax=Reinekea sp. TaxID=1970455 RepID=UPI002A7EBD49|nr:hypothetical protein [Reinekea sp.]
MPRFSKLGLAMAIFITTQGLVQADSLYRVDAAELMGISLFDQELIENGLVTVKPSVSVQSQGDLRVLERCLWSIGIEFSQSAVIFTPGKMICIGPEQEVLETIPSGTIEAVGGCSEEQCTTYRVSGGAEFTMHLDAALSFKRQPRNERQ